MRITDTDRLNFLMHESYDLRSLAIGDDDIGWRVVGHWQAEPRERTIAEVFEDSPRMAIDAAMSLSKEKLREISHQTKGAE